MRKSFIQLNRMVDFSYFSSFFGYNLSTRFGYFLLFIDYRGSNYWENEDSTQSDFCVAAVLIFFNSILRHQKKLQSSTKILFSVLKVFLNSELSFRCRHSSSFFFPSDFSSDAAHRRFSLLVVQWVSDAVAVVVSC